MSREELQFKREYDIEFAKTADDEDLTKEQKKYKKLIDYSHELRAELSETKSLKAQTIDGRLAKSYRLYRGQQDSEGKDTFDKKIKQPRIRSRVYMNITRQITNDGASQLGDMLFPVDDKNYSMEPGKIAEPPLHIAQQPAVNARGEPITDAQGQQLTNAQAHQRRVEKATRRTKRMFTKVDNSLQDTNYPKKARKCIFNGTVSGTGILKGPIPKKLNKGRWAKHKKNGWAIKNNIAHSAHCKNVSPFDFFPDMTATEIEDCRFIWERMLLTPEVLAEEKGKPGVLPTIDHVLTVGVRNEAETDTVRDSVKNDVVYAPSSTGRFEVWERHGYIDSDYLRASGFTDIKKKKTFCLLWMCHDTIIKVLPLPYLKHEFIYSVFNWDEDPFSIFGFGIPYLMEDAQATYTTAWRMCLDNAGVSVLPQTVVDKSIISPAVPGEDYTIYGGKEWLVDGQQNILNPNRKPFETFSIKMDIQQLFALMDKAEALAYELTGVTRVVKTQQGVDNAPVTLGATQIYQNNSSVSRRAQARRWDDQVTTTLITRYYNFFMQYEEDDDIKTDITVIPRGSTVLLSKELMATNLMQFFTMTQGGQMPGIKPLELLRAIATSMQFPENKFIESDDEAQQRMEQQQEQSDPGLEVDMHTAETKRMSVEVQAEKAVMDDAQKTADREADLLKAGIQVEQREKENNTKVESDMMKAMMTDKTEKEGQQLSVLTKSEADRENSAFKEADLAIKLGDQDLKRDEQAIKVREMDYKIQTGKPGQ